MSIILKAKCQIIKPNWRIVKYLFHDLEMNDEEYGEYVMLNMLRERGLLEHDRPYRITIDPLFPH